VVGNNQIKAEENIEQEVIEQEKRIRQFSTPSTIFDYFSSYQSVDRAGHKTTLMSVSDYYNAVTPGSTLTHGTGRGVYTYVDQKDMESQELYDLNKLPMEESMLNKVQKEGLLTYIDFMFLNLLLATPRRYINMAFHAFDISADGIIELKEYLGIMSKIAKLRIHGDGEDISKESGLINYLFGRDRKKRILLEDFFSLQKQLKDDILYLEFGRYDKNNTGVISELDFCKNILYSANLTHKTKERMLKRIEKRPKSSGITLDNYKDFYNLLFGGADLERALFFLDTNSVGDGVNKEEFAVIAKWVLEKELDPHIIDVIFTLLDENFDGNICIKELQPVLFNWRASKGFDKVSVNVSLGHYELL